MPKTHKITKVTKTVFIVNDMEFGTLEEAQNFTDEQVIEDIKTKLQTNNFGINGIMHIIATLSNKQLAILRRYYNQDKEELWL